MNGKNGKHIKITVIKNSVYQMFISVQALSFCFTKVILRVLVFPVFIKEDPNSISSLVKRLGSFMIIRLAYLTEKALE